MGKPKDPGKGLRRDAQKKMEQAVAELEAVGIPSIEAQKIVLERPELVGLEEFEAIGPSKMEDVMANADYIREQEDVLSQLGEMSESGLTGAEQAQRREMLAQTERENTARDKAILQDMAMRGQSGGGAELAQRIAGSQASANRAASNTNQLAQQAQARALQALSQKGNMASQLRSQDFSEQGQRASAADRIAQMNWQAKQGMQQRNLDRRQQMANQQTNMANQEQMHNKALIQQDYANRFNKAQAIAGARTGQSNQMMQASQMQPKGPSIGGMLGTIGGGIIGGIAGAGNPAAVSAGANVGGAIGGQFGEDGGVFRAADGGNAWPSVPNMQLDLPEHLGGKVELEADRLVANNQDVESGDFVGDSKTKSTDQDPSDIGIKTPKSGTNWGSVLGAIGKGLSSSDQDDSQPQVDYSPVSIGGVQVPQGNVTKDMMSNVMLEDGGSVNTAESMDAMLKEVYPEYADGGTIDEPNPLELLSKKRLTTSGEGDIIDSGMDSLSGDKVPALLNDGESVSNIEMQQNMIDLINGEEPTMEVNPHARMDEMADGGLIEVDREAQDKLVDVLRGHSPKEELEGERIVEPTTEELADLLGINI